jgi:hypothetical protein
MEQQKWGDGLSSGITDSADALPEISDINPEDRIDETLDALISLIDATSSTDTHRVLARHLLGAFDELATDGGFPSITKELDESAIMPEFFNALDELIELGFVSLSFQGYGLTESGKHRAARTANPAFDPVAAHWRL